MFKYLNLLLQVFHLISQEKTRIHKSLANIQCGKYFKETKNTEKDLQKNEVKHEIIEENTKRKMLALVKN